MNSSMILIVEDESLMRNMLEALFTPDGYALSFACDGGEALRRAAEIVPDLILLDVDLPGMDGFEVCRRLRSDPALAEVPVIFTTALDDRPSRLRGIEAGADDFVTKPVDSAELRLRVKNILRLNRYRLLVAERTRFERMFELSPEGILLVDGEGKIQLANPALEALLGFNAETRIVGRNLMDLIAPEQREHCIGCFHRLITGDGRPVRVETWFVRQSGQAVPVEVNAGKFEWLGAPAAQVFVHDIIHRQAFARKLVAAQEAERRFIARELHDEVGQLLTGLKISLDQAVETPPESPALRFEETRCRVDDLLEKVRGLSLDLRPQMLDELGLLPALEMFFDRFSAQTRLRIDFKQVGLHERLDPEMETAAYRLVQEALTNVARHAKASKATVRLWLVSGVLGLQIEDEGCGFDVDAVTARGSSSGLAGMRERLAPLGGFLCVESSPGAGTCLIASVPLPARPTYQETV